MKLLNSMKKLSFFDKEIITPSLSMFKSRILNMLTQMIMVVLIVNFSKEGSGSYLIASQLLQVFIVVSSTLFLGVNIKSGSSGRIFMKEQIIWLIIVAAVLGFLLTIISFFLPHLFAYDKITSNIFFILCSGVSAIFLYSVCFYYLESTGKEKIVVKINFIGSLITLVSTLALFLSGVSIVTSAAISLTASRLYMAAHALPHCLCFTKIKKPNFLYLKRIFKLGIRDSLTSASLVSIIYLITQRAGELLSHSELTSLFAYFSVMNFFFVTGYSAVISMNRVKLSYNKFLKKSLGTNAFYLCIFILSSPLISYIIFSGFRDFSVFILISFAIFFDLLATTLLSRLRDHNERSITVFVKMIPFLIVYAFILITNHIDSFNIMMAFTFSNFIFLVLSIIIFHLWKTKCLNTESQA